MIRRGLGWTLHCCEALTLLRKTPDESVDAVITDPPYSSGGKFRGDRVQTTKTKYQSSGDHQLYAADFAGDNKDQRSFRIWLERWLFECFRVMKSGAPIVLFCDWRQLPTVSDELQVADLVWRGIAVWDKTEGCRPMKGAFRQQGEFIIWGSKGPRQKASSNAPCLPGVFRCAPLRGGKHHVTSKPLDVMRQVVEICEPGGMVIDPFVGSGTTGIACLESGRRFIGCERIPQYFDLAAERLKNTSQFKSAKDGIEVPV